MWKFIFVVRASCSLDIHSKQDACPIGHTALTHYQIVFLQNRDAPSKNVNITNNSQLLTPNS
ncbi:MAG: hypothetical protein AAF630_17805 [Cyanobacteria bacterium P01_C01_bin.38]